VIVRFCLGTVLLSCYGHDDDDNDDDDDDSKDMLRTNERRLNLRKGIR
jgi:hypothetical protein